jgi:LL-H family phage holin
MDSELVSILLNALVPALVTAGIAAAGYIARLLIQFIKARTTKEQYAILQTLALEAVRAVEQTAKSDEGKTKFVKAKTLVEAQLLSRGIRLETDVIAATIEAAVYKEFGKVIDL